MPVTEVDWKALFKTRWKADCHINGEFGGILHSSMGRIPRIEKIIDLERDAKDALLKHVGAEDDTDMPLARDFWSRQILLRIGRGEALDIWARLANGEEIDHALALSAYDAFTMGDLPLSDPDDIDAELQSLADQVRATYTDWDELHTRSRAFKLAEFLREKGFRGVRDPDRYHALPHNFIGLALSDPEHNALPLICAVIYSSIARRVGVKAGPISFPLHVYVNVQAPMGVDLDGKASEIVELTQEEYIKTDKIPGVVYKVQDGSSVVYRCIADTMYIDAFRPESDQEVSVDALKSTLSRMGVTPAYQAPHLRPCSTRELVLRTRGNILTSLHEQVEGSTTLSPHLDDRLKDFASYSTVWAHLILPSTADGGIEVNWILQRRRSLPSLCHQLRDHWPWDVELAGRHILPIVRNLPEYQPLRDLMATIRFEDLGPLHQHPRNSEINRKVKYKVGQVFTHRRYGYTGMILGWDTKCEQDEDWISQMRVDSLSGGRNQSFYNVM